MKDIISLEPMIDAPPRDYYALSYPCILRWLGDRDSFTETDVLLGVSLVYGWMPTIPHLYQDVHETPLKRAATVLEKAREAGELDDNEIQFLVRLINNSLPGVSKLLHFTAPQSFSVWDSNIYRFMYEEAPYFYRLRSIENFRAYHQMLRETVKDERFPSFHRSVNKKIGYDVSAFRSIEVMMFAAVKQQQV